MVKGKATATVSGRTIAETEEYEIVEGNIYVCLLFPLPILIFLHVMKKIADSLII